MKSEDKLIESRVLVFFMPALVFVAKLIRYTIMYYLLIEMGIWHSMLPKIVEGIGGLQAFGETGVSDAAGNATVIFRWINICHLESLHGMEAYITIIWNVLLIFLIARSKKELTISEFIFWSLSIIVLNLFSFTVAKEPVQLLIFLAMYYVLIGKNNNIKSKIFMISIIIVVAIVYFRIYYVLFFAFIPTSYLIMNTLFKKEDGKISEKIVLSIVGLTVLYFVFLSVAKILSPEDFEELIRVRTRGGEATTQIINWINVGGNNIALFSLNFVLILVRMLFPIELLPMGIKYWPYALYQFYISFYVIKGIKDYKNWSNTRRFALIIFLGFLLTSASFEPDFGSWVRHESVTLPIILIFSGIIREETEEEQSVTEIEKIDNVKAEDKGIIKDEIIQSY